MTQVGGVPGEMCLEELHRLAALWGQLSLVLNLADSETLPFFFCSLGAITRLKVESHCSIRQRTEPLCYHLCQRWDSYLPILFLPPGHVG